MSSELIKLNTSGHNSYLDELMDNKVNVYLKAKLTKRLTYGEYIGEPKNGFELLIGDERKPLNLDNVGVFTCKDKPSLNDDQQVVLESLKHYYSKSNYYDIRAGKEPMQAVDRVLVEAESDTTVLSDVYYSLTEKQQFQVLAAFANYGLEGEG